MNAGDGLIDERPILELRNVVKDFGGVGAVDRCSLKVMPGAITGLIGPNGAGKTTLFNLVSGAMSPTSGEILFHGRRIDRMRMNQTFELGLARTFQIPREMKRMTVLENLMLVPAPQIGERVWTSWLIPWRVDRQERRIESQALEVLEFVNLAHLADEYARNLSGGQKKLLEFARTLMAEPRMVLLDEPWAGLAPAMISMVLERIRDINAAGVAFLLVEQNAREALRMSDRGYVLSAGENRLDDEGQALLDNPEVARLYLGG